MDLASKDNRKSASVTRYNRKKFKKAGETVENAKAGECRECQKFCVWVGHPAAAMRPPGRRSDAGTWPHSCGQEGSALNRDRAPAKVNDAVGGVSARVKVRPRVASLCPSSSVAIRMAAYVLPPEYEYVAYLGYAYAVAGRARDARDVLKELDAHLLAGTLSSPQDQGMIAGRITDPTGAVVVGVTHWKITSCQQEPRAGPRRARDYQAVTCPRIS